MFDMFKRLSQTWVFRGLLVFLALSMIVFYGGSRTLNETSSNVITVADQKIDANEFSLAYQRQLANLGRQFGTRLTAAQAKMFGVDRQVYSQLIAGASLDQLASDMNLGLSQDRLAKVIAEDPSFKNVKGQFDRQLFASRLANARIREKDYIQDRSKVAVRSQIVDAVSNGFSAPKTLSDAIAAYNSETRTIDYLILTNANVEPVKAPSEEVLTKWFETVKQGYRAPEYRKLTYLKLEASDIANPATISDEAVRADFEKHRNTYTTPELRAIDQLNFANKDLANSAADALKSGVSFDQLVTDQGNKSQDVYVGEFSKDKLPDQAVADAAFSVAKEGATTPVVDGSFGPVILRIKSIKPEQTKTFDEVKNDIRQQLALGEAVQDLGTLHDQVEDMQGSGASLEDIAKQLNLKTVTIDAVDINGLDKSGQAVSGIPAQQQLLEEAFKAEVNATPSVLNLGNNGYVWVSVSQIVPERERPLVEVREKAIEDWTAEQQKAELAKKADALVHEARRGKSLADIAAPLGIAVENKTNLTRRSADDAVLGRTGIMAAFSGPQDTVAHVVGADPSTQILLKVTDVSANSANDSETQTKQSQTMANMAGDDILDQMVRVLQSQYGATINQPLAEQIMVR